MSLKFVDSPTERALRSVGGPPNGIVGFSFIVVPGEEPHYGVTVSQGFDPAKEGDALGYAVIGPGEDPHGEPIPVELSDAVEALENFDAASALWSIAAMATVEIARMMVTEQRPRDAIPMLEALDDLNEGLQERFRP